MNAAHLNDRSRWITAGAGALALVAVILALFLAADLAPPTFPEVTSAPMVVLAKPAAVDDALREETMMNDLTPLFLPTEHNAKLPELPLRAPGKAFLDSDPIKLTVTEAAPRMAEKLPPVATLNGKPLTAAGPLDALAGEAMIPLARGFGREEVVVTPVSPRGAFVEVIATAMAEKLLVDRLPLAARPPTDQLWEPLEFFALVNAAGLVGPLELTRSSRVEMVDNHFKKYLTQSFRIGQRLPPGFYRITVGP